MTDRTKLFACNVVLLLQLWLPLLSFFISSIFIFIFFVISNSNINIIPIKKYRDGFLGVNFHYLSVPLRLKLLEKLQPMTQEGKIIGWSRVARIRQIKPCVKRYLASHVESRFLKISEEQMQLAAMMPVQRFKKEKKALVWKESRRMIA